MTALDLSVAEDLSSSVEPCLNKIMEVDGGFPTGRSIGAGRDKSGPTGVSHPFTIPLLIRYSS